MESQGVNDAHIPTQRMLRRPDGYLTARDAELAAISQDRATGNGYFAELESAQRGPRDDDAAPAPTDDDAPLDLVPVAGDVATPAPTTRATTPRRTSKAARREANLALAATVRSAGYVPNGAPWQAAKALAAAGETINADTMARALEVAP